jgi:hypothetical protein
MEKPTPYGMSAMTVMNTCNSIYKTTIQTVCPIQLNKYKMANSLDWGWATTQKEPVGRAHSAEVRRRDPLYASSIKGYIKTKTGQTQSIPASTL